MDADATLAIYESISHLTTEMLVAARGADWDRLVDLEKDCSAKFARLLADPRTASATPDFQRRKAQLIRKVLDDDAQIRLLVEPWLADLSVLIETTRRQHRLNQFYQTGE